MGVKWKCTYRIIGVDICGYDGDDAKFLQPHKDCPLWKDEK